MTRAENILTRIEELKVSRGTAIAGAAGGAGAGYLALKGIKKGMKAVKGAIEGSDAGGTLGKIKKVHDKAKELTGE